MTNHPDPIAAALARATQAKARTWTLSQDTIDLALLAGEVGRLTAELAVMRPVAKAASDADWHFQKHGKGRLVDADYTVLWRDSA